MIPQVLIAEDRRDESQRCVEALSRFNIVAKVAESSEEVQEHLRHLEFDCLWMDLNFNKGLDPDFRRDNVGDGIDLIAQADAGVPALICSAFSDRKEARAKATRLGADQKIAGWYSKPYDADVIAFEALRVVDMRNWKLVYEDLEQQLQNETPEEAAFRRNFWRTEQPATRLVRREKGMLTGKLVQLLDEMRTLLQHNDAYAGLDSYVKDFSLLVSNHLNIFFRDSQRPYKVLADHLVFLAQGEIDKLIDIETAKGLKRAVECLERDNLSDEDVFEVKSDLEGLIKRPLGAVLGESEESVLRYLVDLDLSEDEK